MYYDKLLDETDEEEIKELLLGRKVTVKENGCNGVLLLDNGIELEIVPNKGCVLFLDNAIELETVPYKVFVFTEDTRITSEQIDGTDGNGYYGTGYEIYVRFPKEVE